MITLLCTEDNSVNLLNDIMPWAVALIIGVSSAIINIYIVKNKLIHQRFQETDRNG